VALEAPPSDVASAWEPLISPFIHRAWIAYIRQPFVVTSWWRSFAENNRVGGMAFSQHLVAIAIDALPIGAGPAPDRKDLVRAFQAAGLVAIDERDHVHAQLLTAGTLQRIVQRA